jgi:hypothetical protein
MMHRPPASTQSWGPELLVEVEVAPEHAPIPSTSIAIATFTLGTP